MVMRPAVGHLEAGDAAQGRGLAAAARAEQRDGAAGRDVEVDAAHRLHAPNDLISRSTVTGTDRWLTPASWTGMPDAAQRSCVALARLETWRITATQASTSSVCSTPKAPDTP